MRTFLLILLLSSLPAVDCLAASVDVYTGVAAVQTKDVNERNRALPRALRNVLQKVSGLRSFEDYPLVEPALEQAASIMLSFYYENVESVQADQPLADELLLVVKFSANPVDEMVRALGLPLWPAARNSADIWVVVDDGLDRRVMPVEFAYAWQTMANAADRRGFPVNWPEPDSEGLYAVDTQLLWGGYTEDLGLAENRGALILAARREGLEWGVRSNMSYDGQSWTWRVQDIDLQAALTESLEQAVDRVAAAKAIAASDLGAWSHQLTVTGLETAGDYIRCLGYLQKIGIVTGVSVISAQPGQASFRLELSALPRYLEEVLSDGQVLQFNQNERQYYLLP